jgi:mRNA-degrading endonuclease toxin of MazEF toxin-antitoxin module
MSEFPQRGEIYLVKLPGHPRDRKARPALVVSLDVRNRLAHDVMVVPLSTSLREAPTHVRIAEGEGGLDYISMATCEQLTTLDKEFLLRGPFTGRVREATTMGDIERAIMRAIGIVV